MWSKIASTIIQHKVVSAVVTASILAGAGGVAVQNNHYTSHATTPSTYQNIETRAQPEIESTQKPAVEVKQETIRTVIPFEKQTIESNAFARGYVQITTAGVDGERAETYDITFTDGVETERKLVSSVVTLEPVTEVTTIGTYEAPAYTPPASSPTEQAEEQIPPAQQTTPSQSTTERTNGSYINSMGNTVCRPSPDNNGGATAVCQDGSYSYSQSRRGTCSRHGGVKAWL